MGGCRGERKELHDSSGDGHESKVWRVKSMSLRKCNGIDGEYMATQIHM